MELKFIGAAGIVTGSCHMLSVKGKRYLLDCGMFQGSKEISKKNFVPFPFEPKRIRAVLLSHAHIDHVGLIPKLYRDGFKGKVYCTKATKDLCKIMLEDSADVQERETIYDNKRLAKEGMPLRKPLYEKEDARKCMRHFVAVDYDAVVEVGPGLKAVFSDAGHILGSAIISMFASEGGVSRKIVFSGDIGKPDSPLVRNPTFLREADYVIMESTYGSRVHEDIAERSQMLLDMIIEVYNKGGRLMIPSFALERTQEIVYAINEFVEKGIMPKMGVFVDSPLATKATEVFMKHPECYDEEVKDIIATGDNPFTFPGLKYIASVNDSKKLNKLKEPCIIIAGSGMCTGGRIKHHLRNHLNESNSAVLFVGYQAAGTLGRRIRDGARSVKIYGKEYPVKVSIKSIGGFSAHADKPVLASWARSFATEPKIYLVHGEPKEAEALAAEIRKFNRNVRAARMYETVRIV